MKRAGEGMSCPLFDYHRESFEQSLRPTENTALRHDAFAIEIEAVDGAGDLIQFDPCAGDFQRPGILNTLVTETIEFRGFNISVRQVCKGGGVQRGGVGKNVCFSGASQIEVPHLAVQSAVPQRRVGILAHRSCIHAAAHNGIDQKLKAGKANEAVAGHQGHSCSQVAAGTVSTDGDLCGVCLERIRMSEEPPIGGEQSSIGVAYEKRAVQTIIYNRNTAAGERGVPTGRCCSDRARLR